MTALTLWRNILNMRVVVALRCYVRRSALKGSEPSLEAWPTIIPISYVDAFPVQHRRSHAFHMTDVLQIDE